MFDKAHSKYTALVGEGDNASSEMLISDGVRSPTTGKRQNATLFWLTAMNAVFFLAGIACLLGTAHLRGNTVSKECLSRVSSFCEYIMCRLYDVN